MKVNSDGAYKHTSQLAASGGLIRDENERILKAYQAYIGQSSIIYAELVGIWMGLNCCRMGYDHIVVDTDSKVALSMLRRKFRQWNWKFSSLMAKSLRLCEGKQIRFQHAYRESNSAADWLAKDALKRRTTQDFDSGNIPIPVRRIT